MTRDERVRALLGNLKNWSWDVAPQFKVEKEDSDALRDYVKELETKIHDLNQRVQEEEPTRKENYNETCWVTGEYVDNCCCEVCDHREECSGYWEEE